MTNFVRKYGQMRSNQFTPKYASDLFDTIFGKYSTVPKVIPVGTNSVGQAVHNDPDNEPRFKVAHIDKGKDFTVAVVGKGITFDTGGCNLKTGSYIDHMYHDKLGAINAIDVGRRVQKKDLPFNLVVVAGFTPNLIGSRAQRPGDVIVYKKGKKDLRVEVSNTDAEGRLILADGILEAQARGADIIVDIATLTGAIVYALGPGVTGIFGTSFDLNHLMHESFPKDRSHIMPVFSKHRKVMKCLNKDIADLSNCPTTSGMGGASTAAAFLEEFLHTHAELVHLDIAGMGFRDNGDKLSTIVSDSVVQFLLSLEV